MVQVLHCTVGIRQHTPACTIIDSMPIRELIVTRTNIQTMDTTTMGPLVMSILTYLALVAALRLQPVPTVQSTLVGEQTRVELRQVAASLKTITVS